MLDLVTENDALFHDKEIKGVISYLLPFYGERERFRENLDSLLKRAKKEGEVLTFEIPTILAGYDEDDDLFFVIHQDFYDPGNLLAVLFDKIFSYDDEDYLEGIDSANEAIELYFKKIEERESVDLREKKEELERLTSDFYKAFFIFCEREATDEEMEEYSQEIEKSYFEPVSEILNSVLVEIIKVDSGEIDPDKVDSQEIDPA